MEPIRPESGSPSRRRTGRGVRRTGTAHSSGFLHKLEEASTETPSADEIGAAEKTSAITGDLEDLLDAVHSSGDELINKRTYSAAERYREAIQAFLRKVVPDSVSVETHETVRGIMNRKRYYLLSEINREVDRLVAGVLQSQSEQVEILARLRKIEGLLVDLTQ